MSDNFITVSFTLATSQKFGAYGGIQLPEDLLEDLAAAVNAGKMPMHFNHDLRRPIETRNARAWTERDDDGYLLVRGEMEMPEDDYVSFKEQLDALGAPGGMSFTFTNLLETIAPADSHTDALIKLACDAAHFSQDDVVLSARALSRLGTVEARELYQFQFDPLAVVLILFASGAPAVAWNVVSSYLYAAISRLHRKGRRTRFEFVVHETPDERRVSGTLDTEDVEVVKYALDKFGEIATVPGTYDWDADGGRWVRLQRDSK